MYDREAIRLAPFGSLIDVTGMVFSPRHRHPSRWIGNVVLYRNQRGFRFMRGAGQVYFYERGMCAWIIFWGHTSRGGMSLRILYDRARVNVVRGTGGSPEARIHPFGSAWAPRACVRFTHRKQLREIAAWRMPELF